ncbi:hypothetical protein F5Y09DRAFT_298083 [Xylaria sp. FL1042]|nr:hypothetical protein F5Y09DRAFT_298083 [Xylaria sp. FL1042]
MGWECPGPSLRLTRSGPRPFSETMESSHNSKQNYTRTRHGCERCRVQRRKCDEGKPRCKRCIGANAVCKYITHISFKNKSSETLSNDVKSSWTKASVYPNIEFVFDDGNGGTRPSGYSPNSAKGVSQSSPNVELGWPLVGQSPLSGAEVELMKYYNNHIVPWLDVYDQGQTFGHHVARFAMNSPCVLELLLQLSAVCSGRPIETVTRRDAGIFHLQAMSNPPDIDSPSSVLLNISCFVLARTLLFVDRIPDTWEPSFQGRGAFLYFRKFDFIDPVQRYMWFAFLTLILRLEIAYCVMNQAVPVWIPELAHQIQAQSVMNHTDGRNTQQILNASVSCLKLLVDTMEFAFRLPKTNNHVAASNAINPSRVNTWKKLLDGLYAWNSSRPQTLEPLVEIENAENTFPTIIFTSGAGISSNILYHTAMLLLLDNKPDLLSLDEQAKDTRIHGAQMSPHWHAHRICGTAINSEPNSWDPATIAALSLAARRIRRVSQQDCIITFLHRLKVAGWHIDGLIDRLRSEWRRVALYDDRMYL